MLSLPDSAAVESVLTEVADCLSSRHILIDTTTGDPEGEVVSGNHSWLLADPDSFGEVMTNIVAVAQVARDAEEQGGARKRSRRPRRLPSLPKAKPSDELSA